MLILSGCRTALTSLGRSLPASYSRVPLNPLKVLASTYSLHHCRGNGFVKSQRHNLISTIGCNLSTSTMPPVVNGDDPSAAVAQLIKDNSVMVFSKTTCPFCLKLKSTFKQNRIDFTAVELDTMGPMGSDMQKALLDLSGQKTVPNVFVNGKHIGGSDTTLQLLNEGTLFATNSTEHDFDLVVIGGGSGGLSCAKEAAKLGLNVACLDFVKPSPPGTTWGLGGTCVNVGCIPKKLMHQASILGEGLKDAKEYGWNVPENVTHDWAKMVENIQAHVKGLAWDYKVQLREKKVKYLNELGAFSGPNKLELTNKKGVKREITATNFVVSVGGRPKYPDIPGAKEYGITSDDIFSLNYHPGSTLIVGASYISLECAGFLKGIGIDVTVMVRSILLRGFDQQIAEKIGEYMENDCKIDFIRSCVPTKIEQIEAGEPGSPGKLLVTGKYNDGTEYTNEFNTVLFAVGRTADTAGLNLPAVGVKTGSSQKIIGDDADCSNVSNIYAIGDVLEDRPELTPMAIQAGKLLGRRIAGSGKLLTDYNLVPTTVFTPIEYGTCGYSEEDASKTFGEDSIEVYHGNHWPLEWTIAHRPENACYVKLIVNMKDDERIVGFHYLGPNAGEVTQAFAGMMKLKATKVDMENLVGIHPTCAEIFTTMNVTKSSGKDASASGC